MATTAIGSTSMDTGGGSISGRIHGGNQPVAFANVYLFAAGQGSGYLPQLLAQTQSQDDGAGSFSFVLNGSGANGFSCPTSGSSPYIYLLAIGGNTINTHNSSVNNSASVFLATFGACNSITTSSFVNMTEATTVATMAALQQYFTPGALPGAGSSVPAYGYFSTDGTGRAYNSMGNSIALISNMVSNGTAITSTTLSPTGSTFGVGHAGTSVTVTPESAKINALADIIAACINNATAAATPCTTLFNHAPYPNPASTANGSGVTFNAATDVLGALYYMFTNPGNGSSSNLSALFNLIPASAPYQPTPAVAPSDWTIAIVYSSTSTCGANSKHLISNARDLAVDAYNNIWIGNNEAGGNLSQISNNGVPYTCVAVGSGATTGITIDSLSGGSQNVWVADSGSNSVFRYVPGSDPATASGLATFATTSPAMAIAADGSNNIYFTSPADSTLYKIPGGANTAPPITPVAMNTSIGSTPAHLMVDSANAVWASSGTTYITRTSTTSPYSGTQITTSDITNGIAVSAYLGGKNYVYAGLDGTSNGIQQYWGNAASSYVSQWTNPAGSTPSALVTDGAQNVWSIDSGTASLVAVSANQQAISPSSTGILKSAASLGAGNSIVIDNSGNVWVGWANNNAIVEIVGAAVPVYQPYSMGLVSGYFQIKP
jgi:hypothetical protein